LNSFNPFYTHLAYYVVAGMPTWTIIALLAIKTYLTIPTAVFAAPYH